MFKIDAIIDGDARLQLCDLHNRVAQIAPNPLTLLMHWAAHTQRVRLGTAVIANVTGVVARASNGRR